MRRSTMMPMVVCALSMTTTAVHADWFDDFNDGDAFDGSPVLWVTSPLFPGGYDASSGDFVLSTLDPTIEFETLLAAVPIDFADGASVRTQAVVGGGPQGGCAVVFGDLATVSGYVGLLDEIGELDLVRYDNGVPTPLVATLDLELNGFIDFMLQMDVFDGVVSLTAWAPGEAMPAAQLSVADATYNAGFAGIAFQEGVGGNATGTFRFVQASATVIPAPAAAILLLAGVALRRRERDARAA